jgi:hypothetical protein
MEPQTCTTKSQKLDMNDFIAEISDLFRRRPVTKEEIFKAEIEELLSDPAYLEEVYRRKLNTATRSTG